MSSIYTDFGLCPPELSYDQKPCKTGFYSLHSFIYSLETLSTCTVFLFSVCTVLPLSFFIDFVFKSERVFLSQEYCDPTFLSFPFA